MREKIGELRAGANFGALQANLGALRAGAKFRSKCIFCILFQTIKTNP